MKISVRQSLIKEAGIKEEERSSGLNYDFAKNELVRSGSEVSDKLIDIYYKQNKDKLPISDSDLLKINKLVLDDSARKKLNKEEAFFLILGAVKSGGNETESINAINEYLNRVEFQPGNLKTNWMPGVNLLDLNSIVGAWNNFYSEVKREKEKVKRKELESKEEGYISNEVAYDKFGDGWKVVYVPAIGEIEEFPGLPNTSYDRILEGNKNGLCLGSNLKLYQDNERGKIFSVRDPENKPRVTIRIENNNLEEAKGRGNQPTDVDGAIHAKAWFETLENFSYKENKDFERFPPTDIEKVKQKFDEDPNSAYYGNGWAPYWYGRGLKKLDKDVEERFSIYDPSVLQFGKLTQFFDKTLPVVNYWCKQYLEQNNSLAGETLFGKFYSPKHEIYKTYRKKSLMKAAVEKLSKENPKQYIEIGLQEIPEYNEFSAGPVNNLITNNAFDFMDKFSEKEWAKPYLGFAKEAIEKKIKQDPDSFIKYSEERGLEDVKYRAWSKAYLNFAGTALIEKDINEFTKYFNSQWAHGLIPLALKTLAEKDPISFLKSSDSGYPWENSNNISKNLFEFFTEHYTPTAIKVLSKQSPSKVLRWADRDWANDEWFKEYRTAGLEAAQVEDPSLVLKNSGEEWAKPYLLSAVKAMATEDPYDLIYYGLSKYWFKEDWFQKEYLPIAAEDYIKKYPVEFIARFSNDDYPWAKPYLSSAAEYAKELSNKKKSNLKSSYYRLTKLSNALRIIGLSKEATSILNLK